eukprot:1963549-Rhodomonas_salina.1
MVHAAPPCAGTSHSGRNVFHPIHGASKAPPRQVPSLSPKSTQSSSLGLVPVPPLFGSSKSPSVFHEAAKNGEPSG